MKTVECKSLVSSTLTPSAKHKKEMKMTVIFDDITETVRIGYRKSYSHLAVERALHALEFWLNISTAISETFPKTSLNYKARGIVVHDRLLNSLYR